MSCRNAARFPLSPRERRPAKSVRGKRRRRVERVLPLTLPAVVALRAPCGKPFPHRGEERWERVALGPFALYIHPPETNLPDPARKR